MHGIVSTSVKVFWRCLAVVLILAAIVIQCARLIAPYVGEYRQDLERLLNRDMGVTVTLGGISADWQHLRPQFSFSDLQFITSDGELVLSVDSAKGEVDLLESIFSANLQFSQVLFSGVSASLKQNKQGGWYLSGAEIDNNENISDDSIEELRLLVESFLEGDDYELENISLDFSFNNGLVYSPTLNRAQLQNDGDFHRLTASLNVPTAAASIDLIYEGTGNPFDRDEFQGQGYLNIVDYPLQSSAAFVSEAYSELSFIHDGTLNAHVWLQSTPENFLELSGELQLVREGDDAPRLPTQIKTQLKSQWRSGAGFQLDLIGLQGLWSDRQTQPVDLGLKLQPDATDIQILARNIDVKYWTELILEETLLPPKVETVIQTLAPSGSLTHVEVSVPFENPIDFVLKANAQNVAVEAWGGAPQIANFDGYIEATAFSGFAQVDSQQGFLMHYPKIYDQPLVFDQAHGQVSWFVSSAENKVIVHSGLLSLSGDLGRAAGYFYLNVPFRRHSRSTELILQLGLKDSQVENHSLLVPKVVPDSLRQWLDAALVDGHVDQAGFIFSGEVNKGRAKNRSIQLDLNVRDGVLAYSEGWPELKKFSANLLVDDAIMSAHAPSGMILGSQVKQVNVFLKPNLEGKGLLLEVMGDVNGDAVDGLYFLNQTPLVDVVGETFKTWALDGPMTASVDLRIPLSKNQPGGLHNVDVSLQQAKLHLTDLNLKMDNINGSLTYSTNKGVNAQKISAQLWGKPFDVRVAGSKNQGTEIVFSGPVDAVDLAAWSQRPEVLFVDGTFHVEGDIVIPGGQQKKEHQALISVVSDLVGAEIDLPSPYGKSDRQESRQLSFELPISQNEKHYNFTYQNSVRVNLLQERHSPIKGSISFNESSQKLPDSGLLWRGDLGRVNAEQWLPVIEQYQKYAETIDSLATSLNATREDSSELVQHMDFHVDELYWRDWRLKTFTTTGNYTSSVLTLDVEDETTSGQVTWYADARATKVALKSMHLVDVFKGDSGAHADLDDTAVSSVTDRDVTITSSEGRRVSDATSTASQFEAVDFSQMFDVDFSVDELHLDGESFGEWQFKLRPSGDGLTFGELEGAIRGAQIKNAQLQWQQTSQGAKSQFSGLISSRDLLGVAKAWGQDPVIESDSAKLNVDLHWLGSPADFNLLNSYGDVRIDVSKGRLLRNPNSTGSDTLMRLVSLVNVDTWVRRLKLDFSDLVDSGMNFDRMNGLVVFDHGKVFLSEPISVKTTSSKLQLGGDIDLNEDLLDMSLVATLPMSNNAAVITAFAVSLPAAAGLYVISKLFEKQLDKVASLSYSITGDLNAPKVKFNKLFDNKSASKASDRSANEANQRIQERESEELGRALTDTPTKNAENLESQDTPIPETQEPYSVDDVLY